MSHNSQLTTHNVIIKAENISKQYRLGKVGTGTIKHDLNRWWHSLIGKEDPYLKIGETNDRSTKGESDYVWALQDINFEIAKGEVVGIIGKNGAGKSTLLKILSRVTSPTIGSVKFGGRVASLLEVGTGFNGEMTGRENIFLNGAILGMTKKEIASKLDEIIEFSGCERYIDTPVKRYSSGMYVRLAFAVAAFLEPEILIVDEVLAVGDAEFQKKAIGKMQDISRGEGRTVLFVSHNMAAVKSLCTRGIVMEHGKVVFEGGIDEAVDLYINESNSRFLLNKDLICRLHSSLEINTIKINNTDDNYVIVNSDNNELNIEITGVLKEDRLFDIEARFFDSLNHPLAFFSPGHYNGKSENFLKGRFSIKRKITLPKFINKGQVYMSLYLTHAGKEVYLELSPNIVIDIEGFKMNTGWVFEIEKAGLIFMT